MVLNKKKNNSSFQNPDNFLIIYIRNHKDSDQQIMKLFDRYLPLVKSLYSRYSIVGMDFDDWKQEALIVMLRVIDRYNYQRFCCFGPFFRTGLRNRLYDLLRKQNAKKRIPHQIVTSFESNENLYFDTLKDGKATRPDGSLLLSEKIQRVLDKCSVFEKRVLLDVMHQRTFEELASRYKCSTNRIVNAFQRGRSKLNRLD